MLKWDDAAFGEALDKAWVAGTISACGVVVTAHQLEQVLAATRRDARYPDRRVLARAQFEGVRFEGDVSFRGVVFTGEAAFSETTFLGRAEFSGAWFEQRAIFNRARFCADARFVECEFRGPVQLTGARFAANALFTEAGFRSSAVLGPLQVDRHLSFDGSIFERDGQVIASCAEFSTVRTLFVGRADLKIRWADVILDDAGFLQHSWLSGAPASPSLEEKPAAMRRRDTSSPVGGRPRLLSLREATVAHLGLSNIDLRACRFARAQGLDQLRLEADCEFALTPDDLRHTTRRTLAEEHHWRAERDGQSGWYPPDVQLPDWLAEGERPVEVLDPPQIATLYRSLRKALEDSKDEPGAADFYYGEMDMRRQRGAPERAGAERPSLRVVSRAERAIVSAYWALSGYGLRASRALTALVVLIAVFTVGFHLYGFRDRARPYASAAELRPQAKIAFPPPVRRAVEGLGSFEAWTYSAGTATAIIGAPDARLTQEGRAMRMVLRILGPLLIGLALLAIRGRVKR